MIPQMPDPYTISEFQKEEQRPISFGRAVHLSQAGELDGAVMNPNLNAKRIQDQYEAGSSAPGAEMVYFDDVLTESALTSLRRFCLESTVWFDVNQNGKRGSYVGAYMDMGFLPPILVGLAEELEASFPRIFKGHVLKGMWAYKYSSESDPTTDAEGIAIHADPAAVNVNFWITEDDANLDRDSGGLVVYKVGAPETEESFDEFNVCKEVCRERLANTGYDNMTVPYKANRIVIFNSNLYHKTDKFRFKRGYTKRRINITLLFGFRKTAGQSKTAIKLN